MFKRRLQERYIPFGDGEVSLEFFPRQVEEFERLYRLGHCLFHIADYLKKDVDAVTILAMDRKRKRKIECRPGGFWGDCPASCRKKLKP